MQAYATAEQPAKEQRLRILDSTRPTSFRQAGSENNPETALLDQLLVRLADLVADRVLARTTATQDDQPSEWMDARDAAAYLGIHRDTLRKLAAQRAIPTHQDGPRCKLYFRRDELDDWRRSAWPTRTRAAGLKAV